MKPCVCGHDEDDHGDDDVADDDPRQMGCRRCDCLWYQPDDTVTEAVFD